jgi:hypothetical protein
MRRISPAIVAIIDLLKAWAAPSEDEVPRALHRRPWDTQNLVLDFKGLFPSRTWFHARPSSSMVRGRGSACAVNSLNGSAWREYDKRTFERAFAGKTRLVSTLKAKKRRGQHGFALSHLHFPWPNQAIG